MPDQQIAHVSRWLAACLVLMFFFVAAAVIGWVQLYLAVNDLCETVSDISRHIDGRDDAPGVCLHLDGWGE